MALLIVVFVTTAYILYVDRVLKQSAPGEKKEKTVSKKERPFLKKQRKHALPERKRASSAGQKIAVIIDDLGSDVNAVHELLEIDVPIAFSVLPYGSHSIEVAETVHGAGREVLLHLPMEPYNFPKENPGEGALFVQTDEAELIKQTEMDLEAVPHICGVNNHMGSRFMDNEKKLSVVMERIKKKRLFFVDSMTTAHSKGREVAEKWGVPFVARTFFIDNGHDFDGTYKNLVNITGMNNNGKPEPMLLIGHPYPGTIRALRKFTHLLREKNIEIVPLSELMKRS